MQLAGFPNQDGTARNGAHWRKMRMKFNKSGQLMLAATASLLAAGLVTACGTLTTDFVFVSSSKAAGTSSYGEINVYEVNAESGRMRQIPSSPFYSAGRDPVAESVSTDQTMLYVANRDDSTIVQFLIGKDGKLYPQNTTSMNGSYTANSNATYSAGIFPMATAINSNYLFVLSTYTAQAKCSSAAPCSGAVAVFPLASDGQLDFPAQNGSANYWPLSLSGSGSADVIVPTAITVATSGSNTYLYVAGYDSTSSTKAGYVFVYQVGTGGTLTAVSGSPFAAGVQPSGLAADASGAYLYVTDQISNQVLSFQLSSGALTNGATYSAGNSPTAVAVDSTAGYVFVTNGTDSTLNVYSTTNGVLANKGTYQTGSQPVAVGIDPSLHHYIYTVNYLAGSVNGYALNSDGSLLTSQYSPYSSNALPTAVAAITHKTN